jgi:hypothetical protein
MSVQLVGPAMSQRLGVAATIGADPGGDAGLVALGIGQHPPRRGHLVADDPATGRDRGRDPCLGLVVGHPDVEMDRLRWGRGASICWKPTTGLRRCRSFSSSTGPPSRSP